MSINLIIENIEKNWGYITYSIHHKQVVQYLARELVKDKGIDPTVFSNLQENVKYHDMDKVLSYFFMDKKIASAIHRETSFHHFENNLPKQEEHYLEAICDYESAAYTKPDKPLNAYDTVLKYVDDSSKEEFLFHLKRLGIDCSYNPLEQGIPNELQNIMDMEISKDFVLDQLESYVKQLSFPNNNYLSLIQEIREYYKGAVT